MKISFLRILIAIILTLFLASCHTPVKRKDGPPNFYVDVSRIPNAVPKPERLSKFGNMPFYRVFGQRYYVMKSFRNYREIGMASWYGTLYHKRRTSSGEPYDMLGMTAAHRTLPLPTYVEVTNLANNKKIIVKVNDRGPFASDRIIDLSYVGAKKLGMIGRGTTKVEVKAIDPFTFGKPVRIVKRQLKTKQIELVYLQVGAFKSKQNALKLRSRLIGLLSAPIKISSPTARAKLYRVQVGPINDLAAVDQITQRLKQLGIKTNKKPGG